MDLKIFDVEHGAFALLTCDDDTRLMIDCGHNGDTGWRPGTYLREEGIETLEMLAITNYDEDHVSGIDDLLRNARLKWLSRNRSVSTAILRNLKSEDGMGVGIERLCKAIDETFTGDSSAPQPTFAGLKKSYFFNSYPTFDDENNLSMVVRRFGESRLARVAEEGQFQASPARHPCPRRLASRPRERSLRRNF
jgi:beta-lactamase superfamily II metal-dependent hydrolase